MDTLRGVIMLALGVLAFADSLSVPVVLAAAFLASACSVFFSPAVNTLMLDIIPHDDMVRGQSVFSGVNSFVNLVGKAISGALVAFLGAAADRAAQRRQLFGFLPLPSCSSPYRKPCIRGENHPWRDFCGFPAWRFGKFSGTGT